MRNGNDIGRMTRRISFCEAVTGKTPGGAPTKSYVHSFYAWCSRVPASTGGEQYANQRIITPYSFVYRAHYQGAIKETMQLVDGEEKYNIISVLPTDNNMFVDILAEKITE